MKAVDFSFNDIDFLRCLDKEIASYKQRTGKYPEAILLNYGLPDEGSVVEYDGIRVIRSADVSDGFYLVGDMGDFISKIGRKKLSNDDLVEKLREYAKGGCPASMAFVLGVASGRIIQQSTRIAELEAKIEKIHQNLEGN